MVFEEKYEIKVGDKTIMMNFNDVIFHIASPYPPDSSEHQQCVFCDTTEAK